MSVDFKKEPMKGIIPPLVTPLKDPETIDLDGMSRLIEHTIEGGVHGLFVLGSTGEAPGLSYLKRYKLLEHSCSVINNRVPLFIGITDTSFEESINMAKKASEFGADAVVATPPYYFGYSQEELKKYFADLADRSPLPLFVYNMPSFTKLSIDPEVVGELSKHENIVGFKDSSADMKYFQKVRHEIGNNPEFSLLIGIEEMLMPAMLSGAHGGVNGGANFFPQLFTDMYDATIERNVEKMDVLQAKILQVSALLYNIGNSPGRYLQGVKGVLSLLEVCNDTLLPPYEAFNAGQKEQLRKNLNMIGLMERV